MNCKRFMMVMYLGIFMMPVILNAKTVYVKYNALGANTGTSWANAYTDLQNAIGNASSGDQVWVATGTYKPTTGTDRAISFQMKAEVGIYGGFNGTEINLAQRDWNTNETILSGDIGAQGVDTDNVCHVVVTANNSTLDGFIVEKGYASSPVSTPWVGAGIIINSNDSSTIKNCEIRQNIAVGPGGANGGGIFIGNSSGILIEDCIINQNSTSWEGGGVYSSGSNPTIRRCSFIENSAGLNGGGFKCDASGNPIIQNCIFSSNTSRDNGGGVYIETVEASIENCVFYGNSKTAIFHILAGTTTLKNSIVWGNIGTQISGSTTISYSNIQGGFSGTGNINSDPLFADPATDNFHLKSQYGRWNGNSWIYDAQTSPCIDTGDPASAYDEETAPNGGRINMGAYGNTIQASKSAFVVTFIAEANGILTGSTLQEVKYGNACSAVTSVPNTGYHFVDWNGDLSSTANPLTVSNITSSMTITANFAKNDIVSNLVLYYPLDGSVIDLSGYGNNGTITGATLTSDRFGNPDKAYYFDNGDTDELVFGNYTRPSNNFSFGAWVKVDKTIAITAEATSGTYYEGQNYVFDPPQGGANAGAGLSVGTNGIQVFEHGELYLACLASYSGTVGTGWNHVFIVYKNKQPTIYLNGVAVRTGLTSARPNVFAPKITGYFSVNCYGPYNGSINEIRIYNRVFSSPEAMDLYNSLLITASAGINGNISPSGMITVAYGTDKTFTISPLANYHVSDVLVDDISVGAVTEYTFTNVKTSHTIFANFAAGKLAATVNITGLSQTYAGQQLPVTVTTIPAGLKVNITYKGVADEPMNAGSYPVVATIVHDNYAGSKTGTLVIAKANQTINFQALPTDLLFADADYPLTATASSPLPVTYISSNPAVATIVNDAIHIVGVGTATITAKQIGNINYNAATAVSKALVIGKKSQTIEFNAFTDHAMGEKDFAPDATASSGLPVIYTSANLAVATIVSGKIHIVGKGSSVITAKQAGNANWNIAKEISQRLDVAVGTQEITFNALPDKFYGNADFAPGATSSSSSGFAIIYTSSNPVVATIASGKIHITGVGSTDITASQVGNVNWNPASPVTQTLTVGQGAPVITWANPLPIAYGTLLSATQLNATANVPGKFTYTPLLGRKLTAGPQTLSVNFVPTDAVRYNNAEKTVPLTVNRAVATVTIAGLSQTYNGEPRPVTVSTLPAGLIVNTTYNGSADAPTAIGSYTVLSTVDDPNGTGTKTGTLIIAKGVQTINFPVLPTNLCFEGVDYVLGASASSGLPVTYTSSAPLVATITPDGKLHIVGAGTVTISAKQTGNTNYNAAPVVAKAVTIGKKIQTIDFAVFDSHAMGDRDFSPGATAVSGLPITYTSANPAVASIVGGKIHIVGKGTVKITASQAGNTNWSAAPPVSQMLDVAVGTQEITFNALPNKVYGTADFAAGATASSGLAVTYTSSAPLVATIVTGKIHITGVGTSTITASQIGNVNWNSANTVTQTLTVDKGTPIITWANPLPIAYGTLLSATQLNATANVPGKFTYTPLLGRKLTAGAQTLTVSFAPTDAVRYNNAGKTVPLTVNRAVATVTIAGLSQTYNGDPRPVTVSTLPAGLTVNTTYNGSADAPIPAGSYAVTATVENDNYAGSKTGTMVIAKASQTITFEAFPTTLIFGDDDYPLTATASSGLPITYTSSNPLVATIVNDAIHIVGAGTATITAKQTGNTNYNAAISVAKALTIGKRNQTITFDSLPIHATGDADFAPGATTDSLLPVIYTSATPAVATILGGKIHIVGKGSSVITAKQAGNTNWNAASATRTLTVLAAAAPSITSQPSSTSVTAGHISSFTVLAGGMPTPGYLWQVSTDGGVVWNNLENTGAYSGVSTDTLTVTNAAAAMSRYQFRCAVSNRISSATSDPAMLRVESETLNFSGSDDFATAANWSAPTMSASKAGLLTFMDNSLEYTVSSPSADDIAMREWTSNVGSYTNNWAVQADVHLAAQILSNDQYANLNLVVVNAADAVSPLGQTDYISVAIDRYDNGSSTVHNFEGNVVGYYAGAAHDTGTIEVANSSTDAALRISFDSATKELSSWYDADGATGGYSWTLLQKVNIGSDTYRWDMTDSGAFAVLLVGGSGGVTLSSGEAYFDNFQASTDLP